jgi:hypothetical protein
MRWEPMRTRSSRPSRSRRRPPPSASPPTFTRLAPCPGEAERVRDSVPLWFHTFALARGIYTAGIARDHGYGLAVLGADRFVGRSVLDVGAFDGFYSFLAELRGAQRVVAVDNEQYVDYPRSVRRDARGRQRLPGGSSADAVAATPRRLRSAATARPALRPASNGCSCILTTVCTPHRGH